MLVFSLIERVPGLRSVLAPIIRNPVLNPNERHALSRDALRRRHEREKALAQRRKDVLSKLEAREMRSLRADLTRKVRIEEKLRAERSAERSDQILANKKEITEPKLSADAAKAKSGKEAWKQRQEKLSQEHGVKRTRRPPGYRYKRDEPS
jgi:acyl-homoserine lactone acylase PvdQ